jgi:hypothetical protein
MNNDSLIRLAATLDSQSMTGACHRVELNPTTTASPFKFAIDFLMGLIRGSGQKK